MIQATKYKGALAHSSLLTGPSLPTSRHHSSCDANLLSINCTPRMGSHHPTSPPQVLPYLAPISMIGNHGIGSTSVADMNLLYSPTAYLIPSVSIHHRMEPTTAVNTHLLYGYPNANSSSAPDSTNYTE